MPIFKPRDNVFLNTIDIYTAHPSTKLFYCCLSPYIVEKRVIPISYCLKLLLALWRLHLVFNVVKLTTIPKDFILSKYIYSYQILLSLIRKEFGLEAKFWKNILDISMPDQVAKLYCFNLQVL